MNKVGFRKKAIVSVFVILFLMGCGLIGTCLYMIRYSLGNEGNLRSKDIYGSYKEMFSRNPGMQEWIDSLNKVHALRDTFIYSPEDSIRLHAIYIRSSKPTEKTAVIVHGYGDNAVRMLHVGRLYSKELGFNILLPDLRYAGLSEGDHIQMGWKDRLDVMRWMNVANSIFKSDSANCKMVVHGISMGAATTMMVSGEQQEPYVKCFIEDCGYTSVWDEFSGELKNQFGLPPFPILYATNWLNKLLNGWSFSEASALSQVRKCRLPMMFIHGDSDTFVPTAMVYPLYRAKRGAKELWITHGTAHAKSIYDYPEQYKMKVKAFTDKYMK